MRTFIVKIANLKSENFEFVDKDDASSLESLLSLLKRKGIDRVNLTIELVNKHTINDKQHKLFNVLIKLISDESGNDIQTVEKTLLSNYGISSISELDNTEFNKLLNFIIVFSNDFFNLNIDNDENGNFKIIIN